MKLVENLKLLGLSDYEAKAYIGLVKAGSANVTELSQLCTVPRSNLYAVMEKLCQKGFAEIEKKKPMVFRAVDPKKAVSQNAEKKMSLIKKAKEESIKELESLKGKRGPMIPTIVWGVKGFDAVQEKAIEMIRRAKNEIMINVPDPEIISDPALEELKKAWKKGVKVRIATEDKNIERLKGAGMIRIRNKIHGFDMVVDEREVMVAPAIPFAAAWLDNPEMAVHVKDFLNLVWKDSKVLK